MLQLDLGYLRYFFFIFARSLSGPRLWVGFEFDNVFYEFIFNKILKNTNKKETIIIRIRDKDFTENLKF